MAEELEIVSTESKEEKYAVLLPQLKALVEDEENLVANMANIAAALNQTFNFFWVGFYVVEGKSLVLGPFQGPIACTRVAQKKGVCGAAWAQKEPVIVADVDEFPGHISCNSGSKSEIVVPGMDSDGEVKFVLDVDSDELDYFDSIDRQYLVEIAGLLSGY